MLCLVATVLDAGDRLMISFCCNLEQKSCALVDHKAMSDQGIGCSSNCRVSSIVREDAVGHLVAVEQLSGLNTLELSNAQAGSGTSRPWLVLAWSKRGVR